MSNSESTVIPYQVIDKIHNLTFLAIVAPIVGTILLLFGLTVEGPMVNTIIYLAFSLVAYSGCIVAILWLKHHWPRKGWKDIEISDVEIAIPQFNGYFRHPIDEIKSLERFEVMVNKPGSFSFTPVHGWRLKTIYGKKVELLLERFEDIHKFRQFRDEIKSRTSVEVIGEEEQD